MRLLRWIIGVLFTGMLISCGGDAEIGAGNGLGLRASATGIKSVTFQWSTIAGATHYKLFVDPTGSSGFTQVGSDLATTSTLIPIPVHLTKWADARYMVEAHDAGGVIATSSSIGIASLMLDIIGYTKASNTWTGDEFGYRVAVSGDGMTMAVSAIGEDSTAIDIDGSQTDDSAADSGAVYLFVRSGETWVQQAYIKASNTNAFDAFGSSLALSGDGNTLAVGATGEDSAATTINGDQTDDTASEAGAVYLFTRTGPAWSQQAYIKASNSGTGDLFGTSVALSSDGNTLAVGATGEDGVTEVLGASGAVYLFTRSTGIWSQQAYLKSSNAESGDLFGGSVALSSGGNTLAVGATGEASSATGIDGIDTDNSAPGAGAVYLWTRTGTAWSQQAYIKASNTENGDDFGTSVVLSGDGNTLAVGATGEASNATGIGGNQLDNSVGGSGAVYLFTLSVGGWGQQAYIKASNAGNLDSFGVSVSLSIDGNILAVGADQEDSVAVGVGGDQNDETALNAGAVYIYKRTADVWSVHNYVKAPDTFSIDIIGDHFGASIAMSSDGNTLAVGAIGEDSDATGVNGDMTNNNLSAAGAAYLY